MYTYYGFLEKFHTEPQSWKELFEYMLYNKTEGDIKKLVQDEMALSKE